MQRKAIKQATPSKQVIHFRYEDRQHIERDVVLVPINILRFRKDNGRIISDVISYERDKGVLVETSSEAQDVLRELLEKKDPEMTNKLINSIRRYGQKDPAIITADGFLINGNRRKMALMKLYETTKDDVHTWMKVVILPGEKDQGGPPTLKEIEQIENRYQLQEEGKSEYYKFDRALTIRKKEQIGMSLEEQLRDDPNYAHLSEKEFVKEVKKWREEYLQPLNCIDKYLELLNRKGLYTTISTGMTDREGRWQAFYDYYDNVKKKLDNEIERMKLGVEEDEIGDIEEVAFKIIRKRELLSNLPKVHKVMRDLPKLLKNDEAKKKLLKILDVDLDLSDEDIIEGDEEIDERKKDIKWGQKNETKIIGPLNEAYHLYQYGKNQDTPIKLLEEALKKLNHENMDSDAIKIFENERAMKLAQEIEKRAQELKNEFYKRMKMTSKLHGKNQF
ncbi:MAG: hypothetical protein WC489_02020 [Patescibacteria group bacterium]